MMAKSTTSPQPAPFRFNPFSRYFSYRIYGAELKRQSSRVKIRIQEIRAKFARVHPAMSQKLMPRRILCKSILPFACFFRPMYYGRVCVGIVLGIAGFIGFAFQLAKPLRHNALTDLHEFSPIPPGHNSLNWANVDFRFDCR